MSLAGGGERSTLTVLGLVGGSVAPGAAQQVRLGPEAEHSPDQLHPER